MTLVRRFKGRRLPTYPTGLLAASEKVEESMTTENAETVVETVGLPDASWKVSEIDDFAEANGIEFPAGAKKDEKLAIIDGLILEEVDSEEVEESAEESAEDDSNSSPELDENGYPVYEED